MNYELLGFVLSLIGIFLALYAIVHTHWANRASIEIDDISLRFKEGRPAYLTFELINTSNTPIKVLDLSFYDSNGVKIEPMDFTPKIKTTYPLGIDFDTIPMEWDYATELKKNSVIIPHGRISVRHYMNPYPLTIVIKVTTDKRINVMKKTKSFIFDTYELRQQD